MYESERKNNVQCSLPPICKLVAAYQGLHRSFHHGTPGVLGYPSHCELLESMLCCRVLAKRLIGTLSAIPHLILIYQLNDQPNVLSVTVHVSLALQFKHRSSILSECKIDTSRFYVLSVNQSQPYYLCALFIARLPDSMMCRLPLNVHHIGCII